MGVFIFEALAGFSLSVMRFNSSSGLRMRVRQM
jgi:hypothetical protein